MKTLRLAAGCALVLGLTACGGSNGDTATLMPDVVGQQLDDALGDIKSVGFEEEVDVDGGGTFGVIDESNWTVCAQEPSAGRSLNSTPKLTVDRSCADDTADAPTTAAPTTSTPPTTEPPSTSSTAPEGIMNAATSPDLAALLTGPDCSDSVESFASTHRGRTIEFDGHVADVGLYYGTDTQFDVQMYSGDFSETSSNGGPAFKFQDVNIADLRMTGTNVPDGVRPGDNLHIVAQVGDFNRAQCVFFLVPVATQVR